MLCAFEIQAIQNLSDSVLTERTEALIEKEREVTLTLLHHLREMNRRKLLGAHGSLHAYLKAQGYDGGSAQRRIDAMRLLTDFPETEAKILEGKLNLTVAAQVQTFFRQEGKALEQPLARDEKQEILNSLLGKTSREVERELLERSSKPEVHFKEKVRASSPTHSEMKMLVSDEVLEDLETLKGLLAHKHPHLSYGELLGVIAKIALEKLNPAREPKRRTKKSQLPAPEVHAETPAPPAAGVNTEAPVPPVPEGEAETPALEVSAGIPELPALEVASRHRRKRIPPRARIKHTVFQRDGLACAHVDPKTGEHCGSRYFLELHHLRPWALGGEDTPENLTVRCRHHNQRHAIEDGLLELRTPTPEVRAK